MVSIIIPTYNRAHIIGETLDSIILQSYQNWECIVVDDGSADHTWELLEFYCARDERFKYYRRPEKLPKGANSCRNYGFSISRGEYVSWFDSDDVMCENYLISLYQTFSDNLQIVISSGFYVDETLKNPRKMKMNMSWNLFKGIILWENHITTNSVLFRRSFLETKQLFMENISRGQESEFFSRIFFELPDRTYKVIDEPLFLYRQHPETITNKNREYVKSYKESQSYISLRNLEYCIVLRDRELVKHLYKELKLFFFKGLEEDHHRHSVYIFRKLVPNLWKINRKVSLTWIFYGSLLLIIGRNSYRLGKKIRDTEVYRKNE